MWPFALVHPGHFPAAMLLLGKLNSQHVVNYQHIYTYVTIYFKEDAGVCSWY